MPTIAGPLQGAHQEHGDGGAGGDWQAVPRSRAWPVRDSAPMAGDERAPMTSGRQATGESSSPAAGELSALREKLQHLQDRLFAAEAEIDRLRNSKSFRLTAPLRWANGLLKRVAHPEAAPAVLPVETFVRCVALDELPPHLKALTVPGDVNRSHRPLELAHALEPLLPETYSRREGGARWHSSAARGSGQHRERLRIAYVGGKELAEELAFDADVTLLHSVGWIDHLHPGTQDFLLIESSWVLEGGWGSIQAGRDETRHAFGHLVRHCRASRLPVVLWAREDRANLGKLAWLADLVDRCYAVDQEGLSWLSHRLGAARCGLLLPAVQPAIYNPVCSYALQECRSVLEGKILLDGWWELVSNKDFRREAEGFGDLLRVVESQADYSLARLSDGGVFAERSLGVMSGIEKSAILRCAGAELFLGGAFRHGWVEAMMMLRAAACGTSIVLGKGRDGRPIPDFVDGGGAPRLPRTTLDALRAAHRAFRLVMSAHCLVDRLDTIAQDLALVSQLRPTRKVAQLLVSMRPNLIPGCMERFRSDRYKDKELVIVLHGDDVDVAAIQALARPGEAISVHAVPSARSLGDCLNFAIECTDAPFWQKVDDDDHYGPSYTSDAMLYQRAVPAPVFGKPPMFLHLERGNELCWDPVWAGHTNLLHSAEEANAALIAGGTLGGCREVLERVRFSSRRRGGSDSEFIRQSYEAGYDVLAMDGFNFARFRSEQDGFHTWRIQDEQLRGRTEIVGSGNDIGKLVFI